ncbi:MAG: FKBP-type peptidyl-prolyl cis-trans isomerase [Myxococcota bacterium]|nr:FKBP-type peptidyl-prolyl cis-trans isomerase [Myxococcota bacterium]
MENSSAIRAGCTVQIHYTLTNASGQILDSSRSGDALEYVHGTDTIVPGLEAALTGRVIGERLQVSVPPDQGYGEYKQPGPQPLARDSFPDGAQIDVGVKFMVRADGGEEFPVWIKSIDDEQVFVDANHPLAGIVLNFDVEIMSVSAPEA